VVLDDDDCDNDLIVNEIKRIEWTQQKPVF